MAKTPVSMKIDGYKDREVLKVTYEYEQETEDLRTCKSSE